MMMTTDDNKNVKKQKIILHMFKKIKKKKSKTLRSLYE